MTSIVCGQLITRRIGGSLGTAVFGTVFSTRPSEELRGPVGAQLGHGARLTGAQVAHLAPTARGLDQHV